MTGILFPDPMPAVQAFLRADPGVSAIVKDRVVTRPSDRLQYPALRLDDGGGVNLVEDRLDRWRIQVHAMVHGVDRQTEARTLARQARAAFDRMPGHVATGIVITDVDTTMPQVIPHADPPDGKANRAPGLSRATFTALVHYRPNP